MKSFLIERQDDLDILFLAQGEYLEKRNCVEDVKQELLYYVSYDNDELSDEEQMECGMKFLKLKFVTNGYLVVNSDLFFSPSSTVSQSPPFPPQTKSPRLYGR